MSRTHALVTPTYWRDHEQFTLLARSVDRWVPEDVVHHVVVARRDLPLFAPLASPRRRILVAEDLLPRWLVRLPVRAPFWLSLRTRPVKNWILQQIVKLSVPGAVEEDVLYYADSDLFFTDRFDPADLDSDGSAPLFVETGQQGLIPGNDAWHDVAARLLGVPPEAVNDHNYVGQLVPWDRRVALDMLARVEQVHGRSWQQLVAGCSQFSEYVLYGVYVDRVLGAAAPLWRDGALRVNNYWLTDPLDERGLAEIRDRREPHQVAAMISAKSGTDPALIRRVFDLG